MVYVLKQDLEAKKNGLFTRNKKDVSKIIKKEPYFTPFIKKKLGERKTWV